MGTLSQKNPFLVVAIGDFNVKSKSWYITIWTTANISLFGLQQIIKEPTHILDNSSSCIDLIFTSQPNLTIESGVYPSLHPNCHHQVVYAKFNLKIYYPYREVWHYKDANIEIIRKAIDGFNWQEGRYF